MGPEPPVLRPVRSPSGRWRYRLVVGLIWIAVLAAAAAGWRYARTSGPVFGPIIVISIDSLRADRLPSYGYARTRTPAIEALAADGVTFERAYAHSPLTLPSHVSILSGLLPFQSGVRDDVGFPVGENVAMLPRLLRKRGFKTAGIVSNALLRKETGLAAAFGFYDDDFGGSPGSGADTAIPQGSVEPASRDGEATLKVAEHWIDSIGTGRFFLFLHLPGPTGADGDDEKVAAADVLVGDLVAFLKKRGLYTGGVLIVTSGHGLGLGDHGEEGHGFFLYEPVMRIPLIIKPPRRDGGGRHSAALVEHIDLAPTVLDLVGAPRPSAQTGRSLRNVLDSPTATIPDRRVYAETYAPRYRFGWSELQSLTDQRHRYIRAPRPELYDLIEDPRERRDLSETDAATAERLRSALEGLTAGAPAPQPGPLVEAERDRLERMGYPDVAPPVAETPVDPKDRRGAANKYEEACELSMAGRDQQAMAAFRQALKADPSLAPAWERLAALLVEAGRFAEAGEALTALIRLYPEDARVAQAQSRLERLLTPAPPSVDRAVLAASIWTTLGEKARAQEIRSAARKAAGEAAVRAAEGAMRR